MKEGVGGAVSLGLVMFFIFIIASYTAFTINYSKAYKVKSKLIDVIQKYDNNMNNPMIASEMQGYMRDVGYSSSSDFTGKCTGDGYNDYKAGPGGQGWCYRVFEESTNGTKKNAGVRKRYVKIKTFVSVDIPVINQIFGEIRIFTVEGSTRSTYDSN